MQIPEDSELYQSVTELSEPNLINEQFPVHDLIPKLEACPGEDQRSFYAAVGSI